MPTVPADAFPFCGPTNSAISPVFDAQRAINLYPERGLPSSKSQVALIGTPGLQAWAEMPTSPIRPGGLWAGVGRLFVVAGINVYEVDSTGAIITDFGAIPGSTGGAAPVQMVVGGSNSSNAQLLIMDSSVPGIFLVGASSVTSVFPDAWALEYLDSFYLALGSPGATQNQINASDQLDGSTWDPLVFGVKTGTPDLGLNLIVVNNQIFIASQKNIEPWYNAGLPNFPFQRIQGSSTTNTGVLAQYSPQKLDNTWFWLGASERGYAQVYKMQGLLPVRVSTPAIESLIASYQINSAGMAQVTALTYEEQGHLHYMLTFPETDGNPGGSALVYDVATSQWHERYHLSGDELERPLYHCVASISGFGGETETPVNFAGAWNSGKIYKLGLQYPDDDGDTIRRIRTAPHVSNSDRWVTHSRLTLSADCGTADMELDYSNDGGRTFDAPVGGPRTISPSAEVPSRYTALQLGRSRDRVYRVTMDSSTELIRLIAAYLDANPGTEP